MSAITVSGLFSYPVKSLRGLGHHQMILGRTGPVLDRHWMIVDAQGQFLTQRQYPQLCLLQADYNDEQLIITHAGNTALIVRRDSDTAGSDLDVVVWGDEVGARDCGDEAAGWFSRYLARECRLVVMPDAALRSLDATAESITPISFADRYPCLLISEESLADFNQRLDRPVAAQRFRPNILISGAEAFAEDRWRLLRIGDIEFEVAAACARCGVPSIDPQTGQREPIVTRTLATFRRRDQQVYFGQNLVHRAQGCIAVGDAVEVMA